MGVVDHLPADARDDDDCAANAVRDAIGEDGVRQLLG
jgi:hypothetical protein